MRRRERRPEALPAGVELPAELLNPDAPLWFDTVAYLAYMRERRWRLPVDDRIQLLDPPVEPPEPADVPVHPIWAARRRWAAAEGWARERRVAMTPDGRRVEIRQLRALLGLTHDPG